MPSKKERFTALCLQLRELVGDDEQFDLLMDLYYAAMDCHGYSELALGEARTVEGSVQSDWRALGSNARYASQRVLTRHLTNLFAIWRLYISATYQIWVERHGNTPQSMGQLVGLRESIVRQQRNQAFALSSVTLATFFQESRLYGLSDFTTLSPTDMIFVDTDGVSESAMFQDFSHAAAFAALYGKSVEASADGIDDRLSPGGQMEQYHWGQGIVERSNRLRARGLPALLSELFLYKLWLSVVWSGATKYPGTISTEWVTVFWPEYVQAGIAESEAPLRTLGAGLGELYKLSAVSTDG